MVLSCSRRSFLLGGGLTAVGLLGSSFGNSARVDAAPLGSLGGDSIPVDENPRSCRPKEPLATLIEGNQRFAKAWQQNNQATTMAARADAMAELWQRDCFLSSDVLANGQAPWAAVLTCADSRVSPEWVFDAAPSDLFVVRSAGNTAFDDAVASMEFTVSALQSPLIMVMGHSACGAVKAARNDAPLTPLLEQLVTPIRASLTAGDDLEAAVKSNTRFAAKQLTTRSQLLANAVTKGSLTIVASYFDIQSGQVILL